MQNSYHHMQASGDFSKARMRELLDKIVSILTREDNRLLPLTDIKNLLKPKAEVYKGLKTVLVSSIVGSEGRYRDFNRSFLPRHDFLKDRWIRVDMAHHTDIILPPVKLYEIGNVYFVRDGNHRVSVAVTQGVEYIDAEIIKLDTDIELDSDATEEDIKRAVIDLEKKRFYGETGIQKLRPDCKIEFSETGRYDDIYEHINVHKYYLNLERESEMPFEEAMLSWYDNLYGPIFKTILEENILPRFQGRTEGDLYIWIIRHWDALKREYGEDLSIQSAAKSFSRRYGRVSLRYIFDQIRTYIRAIWRSVLKRLRR